MTVLVTILEELPLVRVVGDVGVPPASVNNVLHFICVEHGD